MAVKNPPPYPCVGTEEVFEQIELLDGEGVRVNMIRASECFVSWYAPQINCTWRVYVPPVIEEELPGEDADA